MYSFCKGFEKATFTQGGGSLVGCNVCHFPGARFAQTTVYPWYCSYLPRSDPLRQKRPGPEMYNYDVCNMPPPRKKSYAEYCTNGTAFLDKTPREKKEEKSVDGVKGKILLTSHE